LESSIKGRCMAGSRQQSFPVSASAEARCHNLRRELRQPNDAAHPSHVHSLRRCNLRQGPGPAKG
jgi:hypothetical protein